MPATFFLSVVQVRVLCSNNDDMVRAFDPETFQLVRCAHLN